MNGMRLIWLKVQCARACIGKVLRLPTKRSRVLLTRSAQENFRYEIKDLDLRGASGVPVAWLPGAGAGIDLNFSLAEIRYESVVPQKWDISRRRRLGYLVDL
jgi:hypothetical protein